MLTEPSFLLDPPQINPMDEDHCMFVDDPDIGDDHLLLDDSEPLTSHLMPPTIHLDHDTHTDLLLSLHSFHPHHPPAPPPSPQEPSLLETVFQQQQASYTRKRSSSAPTPFLPQPATSTTAAMPQIPESTLLPSRHHTPPGNLYFAHAKTLDELLRTIASNPNSSSPRVTKVRGGSGSRAGFPSASHRIAPPIAATSPSRIPVPSSRLRPCTLRNRERRSSAGGGWGGTGGGRGHTNNNGTGLLAPPSSPSVSLSPSDVPPSPISSPGGGGLKRSMWLRRASATQRTRQIAHAAGLVEMLRRREVGGGVSGEMEAVGHSGAVVESLISELKEMGL
ncbi:hypothetical protein BC937DRAFT_86671 [Endogone sp. FLAS-F59071]|nr:hypothetical protein BC937DRAFT_86671 [Endogone sp. FLAS-F59071]|eukprot:RUS12929.1 hypothetical protein BC937DRAFT_86671 [Endogone sp. FLAS-F59071]